jgi:hypothetical protein
MAIRAENIPAEPVNPIIIQACSWCKKDEMHVPFSGLHGVWAQPAGR